MPLAIGSRLGSYDILAAIGAGGMGEVYRARDTKLNRDVALKVLPDAFASDRDRLARFEREAQLLASLNHPNIAAIYGLEHGALVLELVEGPTLADRIARGPIPLEEALPIARQIADALESAHEHGIIHRDLKPSNIKLRPDGTVKVLDFGLAKALDPVASSTDASRSPTITSPAMTRAGVVLGTAAYMSPEQARGLPADKRSDVWAFGCVLYEMLAGRAVFEGTSVTETLSEVLKAEPDWLRLPATSPEGVRRLLRRCLQKDPTRRLADIHDARLDLEEASSETPVDARRAGRPRSTERLVWGAALLLLAVAAGAGIVWTRRTPSGSPPEVRFDVTSPPTRELEALAISPDGKTLAFAATFEGRTRLWLRPIDAALARPLAGTDGARMPFWSPDSRSVAFSAADGKLKRIDVSSGTVLTIPGVQGAALGGAWNRDGVILFGTNPTNPLFRVADTGGEPVAIVSTMGGGSAYPRFLPDGRHFLYPSDARGTTSIFLGQLDGPDRRHLVDATYAEYVPGSLLFIRDGTLFAQPFESTRLELTGSPVQVADQVAALSASADGSLAYRVGPEDGSRLVWFDRSGRETGRPSGPGQTPSISSDGGRVAVTRGAGLSVAARGQNIWLLDLARDVLTRLTVGARVNNSPLWSPDGSRVVFSSPRDGQPFALYEKGAGGGGEERLLLQTKETVIPMDWSPDGRFLMYRNSEPKTGFDLWALSLEDKRSFPVVQTQFDEREAQFSPDGRWIAYQSNESGRFEIYLRPFPDSAGARYGPVSTNGGAQVRWRGDGQELFYLGLDDRLMAVPIRAGSGRQVIEAGTPVPLFSAKLMARGLGVSVQQYDVSSDGSRFLVNTFDEVTSPVTVILNWKPKS